MIDLRLHRFGCIALISIVLFCTAVSAPVLAQDQPDKERPYEGLLKETDLRINEYRNLLQSNSALPQSLTLRYRGKEGNFVVFYDLEGQEAFFKYRQDRFDDLAGKKVRDLLKGQAYRLALSFVGILESQIVYNPKSDDYKKLLESGQGRLMFTFVSAEPIQTDFILY